MKRLGVENLPLSSLPTRGSVIHPNNRKVGKVDYVVDGDSVWLWIDLDFDGIWAHRNSRLIGIDAPDTAPGKARSTLWLKERLPVGTEVELYVPGLDKYGRPLVGVYLKGAETSLNQQSLIEGFSVEYHGGPR